MSLNHPSPIRWMLLLCLVVAALAVPASADPITLTANITADNNYMLFWGNEDGSILNFVGRNETGGGGSPGNWNWSLPETWSFAYEGLYLYVIAWDRPDLGGGPQMWIGDFYGLPGGLLVSNTSDWQFTIGSGANPGSGNVPLATAQADIAGGSWAAPLASAPQGTSPWGNIPGISSQARFIWHDSLGTTSSSDQGYVIFRSRVSVPEPGALILLGLGILAVACRAKRG